MTVGGRAPFRRFFTLVRLYQSEGEGEGFSGPMSVLVAKPHVSQVETYYENGSIPLPDDRRGNSSPCFLALVWSPGSFPRALNGRRHSKTTNEYVST